MDEYIVQTGLFRLDPHHLQIIHAKCQGVNKTAEQVAEELNIETHNWSNYVRTIYAVLGIEGWREIPSISHIFYAVVGDPPDLTHKENWNRPFSPTQPVRESSPGPIPHIHRQLVPVPQPTERVNETVIVPNEPRGFFSRMFLSVMFVLLGIVFGIAIILFLLRDNLGDPTERVVVVTATFPLVTETATLAPTLAPTESTIQVGAAPTELNETPDGRPDIPTETPLEEITPLPTMPTNTPEPTNTPAPTPTINPAVALPFFEGFDNGVGEAWTINQGEYFISNGWLAAQNNNGVKITWNGELPETYTITFDIYELFGSIFDIIFGNKMRWSLAYSWQFESYIENRWNTLEYGDFISSDDAGTMTINVNGSRYVFYLNGELFYEIFFDGIDSRTLSFYVESSSPALDNIQITTP